MRTWTALTRLFAPAGIAAGGEGVGGRCAMSGSAYSGLERLCVVCTAGFLLALGGCSTGSNRLGAASVPERTGSALDLPGEPHTRDVITARELGADSTLWGRTAYDAVARLRPEFLTARGAPAAVRGGAPTVFVDGAAAGGVEVLNTLMTAWIAEIRYLRTLSSFHRYGALAPSGAIVVTLRNDKTLSPVPR